MPKRGKKYVEAAKQVDRTKLYRPDEAIALIKRISTAKFDETVDLALELGVDPRHADQQVRGTVVLPHGTGRQVRVAVFAKGEKAKEAENAGADIVGAEDLAQQVEAGNMNFDVAIATPDMMGIVGKLGRILGPRGLMPNPKAGTVTMDIARAVQEFKAGKVEYRVTRAGTMHVAIGKVSFEDEKLVENFKTLITAVVRAKPAAAKGTYLKKIVMSSTMGPGVKIDPHVVLAEFVER